MDGRVEEAPGLLGPSRSKKRRRSAAAFSAVKIIYIRAKAKGVDCVLCATGARRHAPCPHESQLAERGVHVSLQRREGRNLPFHARGTSLCYQLLGFLVEIFGPAALAWIAVHSTGLLRVSDKGDVPARCLSCRCTLALLTVKRGWRVATMSNICIGRRRQPHTCFFETTAKSASAKLAC